MPINIRSTQIANQLDLFSIISGMPNTHLYLMCLEKYHRKKHLIRQSDLRKPADNAIPKFFLETIALQRCISS